MRGYAIIGAAVAALCATAAPVLGQRSDQEWLERCRSGDYDSNRERVCEVRVERIRPTGSLTVDGHRNGAVSVFGWDGDSIVVSVRVQAHARSQSRAQAIADDITVDVSGGRIRADGPTSDDDESWAVHFVVGVPRRTDLTLDVQNGPLSVREVGGRMSLTARNGPVSLDAVSGDVRARVRNGPLTVSLTGTRWDGAGLDAEAMNGPVTLSIPRQYSARLETGTQNGPMVIDYPMTLQGRIDRHITTTLGDGGPTVRVVAANGPLKIRSR